MIEYRTGDVLAVPERPVIIAHIVNDVGAFGAGVALAIRGTFPVAAARFREWHLGLIPDAPPYQLGEVLVVDLDGIRVAHMVAQRGLRSRQHPRPIRYDHLETCLQTVADVARHDTMGVTVAMPRIGCGHSQPLPDCNLKSSLAFA